MPRKPSKSPVETAEDALVGTILNLGFSDVDPRLTDADFHQPALSCTFKSAYSLYVSGSNPTPETIATEASRLGLLPIDVSTLRRLRDEYQVCSGHDSKRLSSDVLRYSGLRKIETVCRQGIASARQLTSEPTALVDLLQGQLLSGSSGGEVKDGRDVSFSVACESLRLMETGKQPGYPTHLQSLDKLIYGLLPGKNIVVGARPGMGKTAFALGLSVAATESGLVLFSSAEMPGETLCQRLISMQTGINLSSIVSGKLNKREATDIAGFADQMAPGRLFIDDSVTGIDSVRAKARKLSAYGAARGLPLVAVVLDYLGLVARERGNGNREQAISEVSRGMKLLANELRCTTVTLSQLNREVEKSEDKRPCLHHLRESGSVEQDADIVLMLYRDSVYNQNAPDDDAEIIVRKNRSGELGTVYVKWDGSKTRFYQ